MRRAELEVGVPTDGDGVPTTGVAPGGGFDGAEGLVPSKNAGAGLAAAWWAAAVVAVVAATRPRAAVVRVATVVDGAATVAACTGAATAAVVTGGGGRALEELPNEAS